MLEPIRLTVTGETPAKKNSRITLKNGKTIPSRRYREWHEKAVLELLRQWNREPIENETAVTLHFFHGDNRRRDSDNGTSSIFDTLQDAHILSDDCWQIVRTFKVLNELCSKNEARCEIEIMEIDK